MPWNSPSTSKRRTSQKSRNIFFKYDIETIFHLILYYKYLSITNTYTFILDNGTHISFIKMSQMKPKKKTLKKTEKYIFNASFEINNLRFFLQTRSIVSTLMRYLSFF